MVHDQRFNRRDPVDPKEILGKQMGIAGGDLYLAALPPNSLGVKRGEAAKWLHVSYGLVQARDHSLRESLPQRKRDVRILGNGPIGILRQFK